MATAISYLTDAITSFWNSISEPREVKERRDMVRFLSQATDRLHLEQLEREWEKKYGRKYW